MKAVVDAAKLLCAGAVFIWLLAEGYVWAAISLAAIYIFHIAVASLERAVAERDRQMIVFMKIDERLATIESEVASASARVEQIARHVGESRGTWR